MAGQNREASGDIWVGPPLSYLQHRLQTYDRAMEKVEYSNDAEIFFRKTHSVQFDRCSITSPETK